MTEREQNGYIHILRERERERQIGRKGIEAIEDGALNNFFKYNRLRNNLRVHHVMYISRTRFSFFMSFPSVPPFYIIPVALQNPTFDSTRGTSPWLHTKLVSEMRGGSGFSPVPFSIPPSIQSYTM
jgi:hypothetical protein